MEHGNPMSELTLSPGRIAGFNSHKVTMNLGSAGINVMGKFSLVLPEAFTLFSCPNIAFCVGEL